MASRARRARLRSDSIGLAIAKIKGWAGKHILGNGTGHREPDEAVGAFKASRVQGRCGGGVGRLPLVYALLAALVDDTLESHMMMFFAAFPFDEKLCAGDGCDPAPLITILKRSTGP